MKKDHDKSRLNSALRETRADQPKRASHQPETGRSNQPEPEQTIQPETGQSNQPEPEQSNQPKPEQSNQPIQHTGSAGAFDATEETRDDEDSDEDNDDLALMHHPG